MSDRLRSLLLLPLVPLYRAALAAKNFAFARGWLRVQRLGWPVISIGNLSVGGAGKTPVVIELARLLRNAGISVDVLSRGYGRTTRGTLQVNPDGIAATYGDEPLLIARGGTPVFVGESRFAAGQLAERRLPANEARRVHLLDDGFQHRQLWRDVDIVILHRSDFDAHLLPTGRLREPLRALRRADVIMLRAEDGALEAEIRKYARADALIWPVQRRLTLPTPLKEVIAFCAIAHPEEFFEGLRQAGATPVRAIGWRDHHRYVAADIRRLVQAAAERPAQAFVTTAKDMARLDPVAREALQMVLPLVTAELEVSFDNEPQVIPQLLRLLERNGQAASV